MTPLHSLRSAFGSSANPLPAAFAVTAAFVALALVEIELPGLYMDEALIDSYVVRLLDAKADQPVFRLPDNLLDKDGRFPIVGGSIYTGLPAAYIGVPYYAFFGMSATSLRIYHALYGVATVFLAFLVMDRFVGRFAAACGAFLLAVDATFVLTYRTHGWNVILGMPLVLGAILLALGGKDPSRPVSARRAFGVGLLYGAACYSYFVYLLFAIPLFTLALCFARRRLSVANVIFGSCGCLLGYAPMLYALASIAWTNPNLFHVFLKQAGRDGTIWTQAIHVLGRFSAAISNYDLPEAVAGSHLAPFVHAKLCFWSVLAIIGPLVVWRSRHRPARILFALAVGVVACYCLQLVAFDKQVALHHTALTLPFLYMALAAIICALRACFSPSAIAGLGPWLLRMASGAAVVGVLCVAGMNVSQHFSTMRQLRATGGVGFFSDAINSLARDLQAHRAEDKVVFCGWGYMTACHFLSRGKIDYAFDIGEPDQRAQIFRRLFALKPNLTFVFPVDSKESGPSKATRDLVYKTAGEEHFTQQSSAVFSQRNGAPLIETIRFTKQDPTAQRVTGGN